MDREIDLIKIWWFYGMIPINLTLNPLGFGIFYCREIAAQTQLVARSSTLELATQ